MLSAGCASTSPPDDELVTIALESVVLESELGAGAGSGTGAGAGAGAGAGGALTSGATSPPELLVVVPSFRTRSARGCADDAPLVDAPLVDAPLTAEPLVAAPLPALLGP